MFLEQYSKEENRKGWIEVITGSMFSGKTEELIRRINRVKIAGQKIMVFKPAMEKRYSTDKVVSHDAKKVESVAVYKANDILKFVKDIQVVCIDEAQFFEKTLTKVCDQMANSGKRVIVAGLDMDYSGKPFGPMPELLVTAEYITKLHAICTNCGELAQYSHRLIPEKEKIVLGEKNEYTPLCRKCYKLVTNKKSIK